MTVTSYLEDVLMILMWGVKMKVLLPSQLEWPIDVKMQGVYLHTDYIFAVVYHYEYRAPKCSNWQIVICGSWVQLLIIGITLSSLRNLSFGAHLLGFGFTSCDGL